MILVAHRTSGATSEWSLRFILKELKWICSVIALYAVLTAACFLMLRTIVGYASFKDDIQFLLLKKDMIGNPFWKAAFYIHVFSAFIALLAGFTQFLPIHAKGDRRLHRRVGKVYVLTILLINAPVGLVLALYANGGAIAKTAFLLLDMLWFVFTYKALRSAVEKNFSKHREYMIRSYALTFSAITFRAWKIVFMHTSLLDPAHYYVVQAWMGFLPNLLFAEAMLAAPIDEA